MSCCYDCLKCVVVFFFKQKTAYEMRISDWSSDVCSSDLSFGSRLLEQPADSADDAVEQSAVARSRNPASGGVLGQGVSGRLFGSAVRSPSSIILPKLGTSERRVEFVVDAPFLAGDFEGFAEDSFGLRLVEDRKSTRLNSSH